MIYKYFIAWMVIWGAIGALIENLRLSIYGWKEMAFYILWNGVGLLLYGMIIKPAVVDTYIAPYFLSPSCVNGVNILKPEILRNAINVVPEARILTKEQKDTFMQQMSDIETSKKDIPELVISQIITLEKNSSNGELKCSAMASAEKHSAKITYNVVKTEDNLMVYTLTNFELVK